MKFLRQHPPIYSAVKNNPLYFIADFYCAELKLVVELDGDIHLAQKDYDENREMIIKEMGLKVVRFKNSEIQKAVRFIEGLR